MKGGGGGAVEVESRLNALLASSSLPVTIPGTPPPRLQELARTYTQTEMDGMWDDNRWIIARLSELNKDLIKTKREMKTEMERLKAENTQITSLNEALQVSKVDMNTEMDRLLAENDELRLCRV